MFHVAWASISRAGRQAGSDIYLPLLWRAGLREEDTGTSLVQVFWHTNISEGRRSSSSSRLHCPIGCAALPFSWRPRWATTGALHSLHFIHLCHWRHLLFTCCGGAPSSAVSFVVVAAAVTWSRAPPLPPTSTCHPQQTHTNNAIVSDAARSPVCCWGDGDSSSSNIGDRHSNENDDKDCRFRLRQADRQTETTLHQFRPNLHWPRLFTHWQKQEH